LALPQVDTENLIEQEARRARRWRHRPDRLPPRSSTHHEQPLDIPPKHKSQLRKVSWSAAHPGQSGFGGTVDTGGYIGATLPNRPENL
jgi:hypothetical protein